MNSAEILRILHTGIAIAFFCFYFYQILYLLVPLVLPYKPHKPEKPHRFAILIAARNEERVLPELISSIEKQDYPAPLRRVFVIADNCTDHTAETARACGTEVVERRNLQKIGKGYALAELLSHIHDHYGKEYFDGYFVFDADNLLSPDYLTQMNRTFSDGYDIVTSYRNAKNFGDNWISAGYGLWFMRESRQLNDARMRIGASCTVSGTGFCFSREALERCDGWRFFSLSEDTEFSVAAMLGGERIGYCHDAVFYDEQPTDFVQSWHQRMRWAKGYLQVFRRYGTKILRGIFRRHIGFSCFDFCAAILPAMLLNLITLIGDLLLLAAALIGGQPSAPILRIILSAIPSTYFSLFVLGLLVTATEWKRINASWVKKLGYLFTFPLFMLTYLPIAVAALFCRVEWKPIIHKGKAPNRLIEPK